MQSSGRRVGGGTADRRSVLLATPGHARDGAFGLHRALLSEWRATRTPERLGDLEPLEPYRVGLFALEERTQIESGIRRGRPTSGQTAGTAAHQRGFVCFAGLESTLEPEQRVAEVDLRHRCHGIELGLVRIAVTIAHRGERVLERAHRRVEPARLTVQVADEQLGVECDARADVRPAVATDTHDFGKALECGLGVTVMQGLECVRVGGGGGQCAAGAGGERARECQRVGGQRASFFPALE